MVCMGGWCVSLRVMTSDNEELLEERGLCQSELAAHGLEEAINALEAARPFTTLDSTLLFSSALAIGRDKNFCDGHPQHVKG